MLPNSGVAIAGAPTASDSGDSGKMFPTKRDHAGVGEGQHGRQAICETGEGDALLQAEGLDHPAERRTLAALAIDRQVTFAGRLHLPAVRIGLSFSVRDGRGAGHCFTRDAIQPNKQEIGFDLSRGAKYGSYRMPR
jgi:hypothetical protein